MECVETMCEGYVEKEGGVVYLCHPFSHAMKTNRNRVAAIARHLTIRGFVPLAPQLFLPHFLDERTERHLAMRICLKLVSLTDEVRVYGEPTEGMRHEIAEARRLGIPVVEVTE